MQGIVKKVVDFLKKYSLQDKTIIVGFSGGFDSMCLLDVLSKIKNMPEFIDLNVVAAHYNHNWRGEEALREQEVCRIFASAKGMEFYTQTASKNIKKTENDARTARYEFFEDAYEEYDADAVFTAHNYDDNAETLLYRIIKGTGIVGLKGISEKRGYFYRPLLTVKRAEIIDYCNENNLAPNNDSSNANIAYKRNYLRLNVIPSLEKINPLVKDALNTLSSIAKSDNDIIEEYLTPIRDKVLSDGKINPIEYRILSKSVKMRLLHEFIQSLDLDYDYKKITEIYEFIEENINQRNGSTKSLATALWLYADEKTIEIIPSRKQETETVNNTEIEISGEGEYQFGENTFVIRKYEDKELFVFPESTSKFAYVDFSRVKFPLLLRTRKDGDVISPFGMSGSMKLKKYLNSKGVPRHNRNTLMLLCKEDEVLWAVGVGLSSKIAVKDKPTHVVEVI